MGALICFSESLGQAPANEATPQVEGMDGSDSLLTISKQVDEVRVFFTVTDSRGRFVSALSQKDFHLLDDGRPPERLYQFQGHTALPLQIVMLVDISSSVRNRFPFEQKAAAMLLNNIVRPGVDRASIITFGSDVKEVQGLTGDKKRLGEAIRRIRPGGDTALFDALHKAARQLDSAGSDGWRKVIVLLTDGADTASHNTEAESIDGLVHSEAPVLIVDSTVPSENGTKGQRFLERLTTSSGGTILPAKRAEDLKGAFRAVEKVLRNQYAVSYKPSEFQTDGRYRTIKLTAVKRGWNVHCRSGYYAKPR